jgi:hypothetical protein
MSRHPNNVIKEGPTSRTMGSNQLANKLEHNVPLLQELCQRIHYEALLRASHGHRADELPSTVDIIHCRQRAQQLGKEVYLAHPADVERMFSGITLGMYQTIKTLYCSRLERSIEIIWRIVHAMALEADTSLPEYEAVWAICMHLEDLRARMVEIDVEQMASTWWIGQIPCDHSDQKGISSDHAVSMVCIADAARSQVLAFRMADRQHIRPYLALALYDALVLQRRPHQNASGGLLWRVPRHLVVKEILPHHCQEGCKRMGMTVEEGHNTPPFVQTLRDGWKRELAQRHLREERLVEAFDSFVHKTCGTSPLRTREHLDREFAHQVGYNRDPAWQFPALRELLPLQPARISPTGEVVYDKLHYVDEVLSYWPDHPVSLRRSEQTEACIWVYLDDNILCQAMARELRRQDGSYRPHRPGRG